MATETELVTLIALLSLAYLVVTNEATVFSAAQCNNNALGNILAFASQCELVVVGGEGHSKIRALITEWDKNKTIDRNKCETIKAKLLHAYNWDATITKGSQLKGCSNIELLHFVTNAGLYTAESKCANSIHHKVYWNEFVALPADCNAYSHTQCLEDVNTLNDLCKKTAYMKTMVV